jgi:HEAT repeat protein
MIRQTLTFTFVAAILSAGPASAQSIERAVQEAQERAVAAAQKAAAAAETISSPQIAEAIALAKRAESIYTDQHPAVIAAERGWTSVYTEGHPAMGGQGRDFAAQRAAEDAAREKERAQRERDREGNYYEQGQSAMDSGHWDRAVDSFNRVIELKGAKTDAALYWKAYAQNKLGQRAESLATIAVISRDYPKSRYLNDARALEVEVKQNSGQGIDPKAESDEEMKLLAISSLQNRDSEDAIPVLQKVLQGTGSPRLKARALFVLAQSNSPKAREVLVNIAKGGSNPDLQMKAVQYLGIHGGRESRAALADVYASSSDVELKKRILGAFMVSGEKDRLLQAAQTEQNAELRATAVQQLGNMGAHDELWALYQKESTVDVKKNIIRAMFTGGNITHLTDIAKSDANPELRLLAVRNLGMMGSKRTGDTLVELYADKDPEVKKAVINGLFVGNNAEGLVALARKEQDPAMKKEIVSRLSNMRSKAATDYLIELLNK